MATNVFNWYHSLNKFMNESADPRTANWPLIGSPVPILIIIVSYLYFVCKIGPEYMKDKKPYSLKTVITVYNIFQVLACAYLFYEILHAGWLDEYSLGCQPVDYSYNPKPLRMASLVWWTTMLKLLEFVETVFFVLRKKQNQISNLHLYHHVSTLSVGWLCTKYTPGGMASFSILPNCLVHVLMYSYYLTALQGGKELQLKLMKWKRTLTIIQMLQFCVIIGHGVQGLFPGCNINKMVVGTFVPNVGVVFYLFYDFYKNAYKKERKA